MEHNEGGAIWDIYQIITNQSAVQSNSKHIKLIIFKRIIH